MIGVIDALRYGLSKDEKDSCLGGGSILPLPEIIADDYHWGN
ncbi:TPA: hypothetical protein ACQNA7_000855 [Streptococcus pyogenes]